MTYRRRFQSGMEVPLCPDGCCVSYHDHNLTKTLERRRDSGYEVNVRPIFELIEDHPESCGVCYSWERCYAERAHRNVLRRSGS